MKISVGIDYSMTSPCVCVHRGDVWSIDNCEFFYQTNKKKSILSFNGFFGTFPIDFENNEERFDSLAEWVLSAVPREAAVMIEGYSYASKGQVFNIGENTGVLKNKLWHNDIEYGVIAPGTLKKFATGKGNSKKDAMYDAFFAETNVDLVGLLGVKNTANPLSDIVDAYYISKYCFTNMEPIGRKSFDV